MEFATNIMDDKMTTPNGLMITVTVDFFDWQLTKKCSFDLQLHFFSRNG